MPRKDSLLGQKYMFRMEINPTTGQKHMFKMEINPTTGQKYNFKMEINPTTGLHLSLFCSHDESRLPLLAT